MHGMIMNGLKGFVCERYDRDTWQRFKDRAGVDRVTYSRTEDYPDEEFLAIYEVISDEGGTGDRRLQQEFGEFLFAELADTYAVAYFDDEWGAMDLLENVEETIHQALKSRTDATFTPPELGIERVDDDRVRIEYASDRQLCDLGKGLVRGVENHYGTRLEIEEHQCMKEGADVCRMEVRRASRRARPAGRSSR